MIYLDYQATTPLAPEVAKAMQPWIEEKFANPHSPSRWGSEAKAAIEVARKQVEHAIGLPGGSVAFTGSATEAINWALKGTIDKAAKGRNRIVTVATEHAAVLDTCEWLTGRGIDLTVLPVQADGRLDLDLIARELDQRVAVVAVMQVNNEIGVTQPISEIIFEHIAAGLKTATFRPTSLFKPPVDDNIKNGDPGTHTKDKINVSNEVAAQIHRAMKMNNLEF